MSTERALLVRTAFESLSSRFFAVGIDFPCVRVFDTATGELCALVEPPKRRQVQLLGAVVQNRSALSGTAFSVSLTSVTMSSSTPHSSVFLAAGLSDGTVLLHDVTKDSPVGCFSVSDTQQAVLAVAIAGDYAIALTKNGRLSVLNVATGFTYASGLEVAKSSSALAAVIEEGSGDLVVFVAGATSVLYRVVVSSTSALLERLVSFSAQASQPNYAWVSADHRVAATCSAQEGVIRIWDMSEAAVKCKRSLPCGNRVGHVRVIDGNDENGAVVTATTFLGQVLIWNLGRCLAPRNADPTPLEPTVVMQSAQPAGKLLVGDLVPSTRQLLTVRGKFAVPRFEGRSLEPLYAMGNLHGRVQYVPLAAGVVADATEEASAAAFDFDNEWASHSAVATRAILTAPEEFQTPKTFHAASVAALPSALTVEDQQRQQRESKLVVLGSSSLGSATIPLYQALHAGDKSLVLELLGVSSRSDEEIHNCVSSLRLSYLLQLLQILQERVKTANCRSPLFRWISAILHIRGGEMMAAQREQGDANSLLPSESSLPKTFVAPLLAQYRAMTANYDKIAHLYGRISIFRGVRPVPEDKKSHRPIRTETATAEGIAFPITFQQCEDDHGTIKVSRVRSQYERKILEIRRSKAAKKARSEVNENKDEEESDMDDDDISLDSDELDDLMNGGDDNMLSLEPSKKRKKEKMNKRSLIAEEGDDDEDEEELEGVEDFDEGSDDMIDSDEESEADESEVDSSPYEEGEEDEEASANGEALEDESDDDDGSDGAESDGNNGGEQYDLAALSKKKANERKVRTD